MTSHNISKLFQVVLSTLAIVPLALTLDLNPARAESPIGEIKNVSERIANRNPLRPAPVTEAPAGNADSATSADREKSMEYLKVGYKAQEEGNEELALANYYTALKVDHSNGYGYLLIGQMLGNTEDGINCVKAAIELFKAEGDRDGYQLAVGLLKEFHASN